MLAGPPTIRVRRAEAADVAWLIDRAADEGWNPGLHDAACFRAADPDGFFVAVDGGERVGGISCVRYGADFAFFGRYLVASGRRGHRPGARPRRHPGLRDRAHVPRPGTGLRPRPRVRHHDARARLA